MQIGRVLGSVWATKKDEQLNGLKFMTVSLNGTEMIAVDIVGAGVGDTVLITLGSSARILSGYNIDAVICGIIDKIDNE